MNKKISKTLLIFVLITQSISLYCWVTIRNKFFISANMWPYVYLLSVLLSFPCAAYYLKNNNSKLSRKKVKLYFLSILIIFLFSYQLKTYSVPFGYFTKKQMSNEPIVYISTEQGMEGKRVYCTKEQYTKIDCDAKYMLISYRRNPINGKCYLLGYELLDYN